MVSVHPNPPHGQGFAHFYSYHFGGDPITTPGMKTAEDSAGASVDDPSKKIRKPYTITKSRESWSEQEHDKFLEALHLFDRDWKKIEAFVGSKTVIQIRSHAQKYFMKVQKNGTSEHVPPPRPKRKAAHPYPHKAPKKVASESSEPLSSATLIDSRYAMWPQPMSLPGNIVDSAPLCSLTYSGMMTHCAPPPSKDDFASTGGAMTQNLSSNRNLAPLTWASNEANHQVDKNLNHKRALPDFPQVYRFIGSVFDPSARDHLKRLKMMDPMTLRTAMMLMKNLSVNLMSPEFESHRKLLSSCSFDAENDSIGSQS